MAIKAEEIKITAVPLDTGRCQFTVERPVVPAGGTFQFPNREKAKEYPLAEEIFDIAEGEITAVQISGSQVTVAAGPGTNWRLAGKEIGKIIREHMISQVANFDQLLAGVEGNSEERIRIKVQRVLDTQINPAVAGHGGQITLLDVKGEDVYIKMGGGCQGCGMASVTLKGGVEKTIRQYVPEVKEIFDTTDHASGKNPFYTPSK
jgi:Fe-S cluster biogenesis protein NfuA